MGHGKVNITNMRILRPPWPSNLALHLTFVSRMTGSMRVLAEPTDWNKLGQLLAATTLHQSMTLIIYDLIVIPTKLRSIAVRTHRPSMLPLNAFTKRCAGMLEQSEVPTDRIIAAWFQLQQILDDFSSTCILDNMPTSKGSADAQVQQRVRYLQNRMLSWKKFVADEAWTSKLTFFVIRCHNNRNKPSPHSFLDD